MTEKKLGFEFSFESFLKTFKSKMRYYVLVSSLLFVLAIAETAGLIVFAPFLFRTYLFAFALGALVLTTFSLFIFRLYSGQERLEKIRKLADQLATHFYVEEGLQHSMIAKNLQRFSDKLKGEESMFYPPPTFMKISAPFFSKISEKLHEMDVRLLREAILKKSILQLIENIKEKPTNPEFHWRLADAYVQLSTLYAEGLKKYREEKKNLPLDTKEEWETQKRLMGVKAIEEFKILCNFSPSNSTIHRQLALSYRDLEMPEEEIQEYETLIKLSPEDHEAKFKLGQLYFAMGKNALGLRTYDDLLKAKHDKAERLIESYGAAAKF